MNSKPGSGMMSEFNLSQIQGVPVLPIRNTVVFPQLIVPLRVGRAKSVAALEQVIRSNPTSQGKGAILLIQSQIKSEADEVGPEDLYPVGTLVQVDRIQGSPTAGYQLVVRGVRRYHSTVTAERTDEAGRKYLVSTEGSELADEMDLDLATRTALLESLKKISLEVLELVPGDTSQVEEMIRGIEDLEYLTHLAGGNMEIEVAVRQKVLETTSLKQRSLMLLELLQKQSESLSIQNEIREKMGRRLGKNQREHILREQLRTIREELGDGEGAEEPGDEFKKKIEEAGLPEVAKKAALEELKRLETMGPQSPESNIIRNYIDWIVALPWSKAASPDFDLEKAKQALESDHYGLDKVKRRILEHLAVLKLRNTDKGSILLLVGPPGVGKTSLGQSIARALGRKYVRASLGGVRDEAEIRGHRRTYIGAMPGRIVQSLKRAGENNPVFILDEIDKLSRGYAGDPSSALLEVLDPEQNTSFQDHYLDLAFDLSKVFFIATANSLEGIPPALLDRMEVIEVSGYTATEKLHIARKHLFPKQLEENGMKEGEVSFTDEALLRLISSYTREAGVRNLERQIAQVLRAAGARVVARRDQKLEGALEVSLQDLEEALGPERYTSEVAERVAPPGVVTGLAWTPLGGEILFIEGTQMPGSGKFTLTGQLGDVMKESAQIAQSLVRSRLPTLLHGFDFDQRDIHLHVPSGAIPKDGPSAGVALLVALASLLTGRSVNSRLAMTGEITLRGAVMPVGGIREKVIAAHRAGIERVLLPAKNRKDLREIPEEVRSALQIEWVETIDELLQKALDLKWSDQPVPFGTGSGNLGSSTSPVEGILARW